MKQVGRSREEREMSLLAVDQYVRQVSWIPALTTEEQAQLAVRIERGKVEQRKGCPNPAVLADAKAARDRFIEGMQRLVIFMAKGWVHSFRGMELLDLVQEGNLGLLDMLEHRDLLMLDRIWPVAVAAVRYRFHRLLRDRDGLVRVPGMVVEAVHKLREVRAQLSCELGRAPTCEEVAQAMGISVEQVRKLESDAKREHVASLEAMVDEDGQSFWENTFASLFQQAVEAERERKEAVAHLVREALESNLTPWQREVVTRWYGLEQECQGSKQIGERYGVTREAVDGAERRARQKLAVSLALPYMRLCGQSVEAQWYSAEQAAALLNLSLYEFTWLVRKGQISRLPGDRKQLARYARGEVERLAAEREERFA